MTPAAEKPLPKKAPTTQPIVKQAKMRIARGAGEYPRVGFGSDVSMALSSIIQHLLPGGRGLRNNNTIYITPYDDNIIQIQQVIKCKSEIN